jgi:hypothetical protein
MNDILKEKYVIISVMGPHAGEDAEQIFSRKIHDIQSIGKTFWVIKSYKANPHIAQSLYKEAKNENRNVYCFFIEPATKGGARPTTFARQAQVCSKDKINWEPLPSSLSPVTGKIDTNSYALVFEELGLIRDQLDLNLWNYAEFENHDQPIIPKLGVSTICSISKDMSNHPERTKTNIRKVIAIGKLSELCCVWLK